MSDEALYLFGFVHERDVERLAGAPLLTVAVNGVAALLEAAPVEEIGPEALQRNLEAPPWLRALAVRHHRMLEAIARSAPVLPAKLGTVFLGRASLTRLLDEQGTRIASALDKIDGKEEWDVKLFASPTALEGLADRDSPALAELRAQLARAGPGNAYLLGKRREQLRRDELQRKAREIAEVCARGIEASVAEVALPSRPDALPGQDNPRGSLLLHLAVLIPSAARARLEEDLSAVCEAHREAGIQAELCGPWPPYSFCSGISAQTTW